MRKAMPSSSSLIVDGPDKLKKKAKNFLDEKQKTKSRAQSLWSYVDATNAFDQAKFFQDHAEQVFQVVFETCMHQIAKLKSRSERPQSWNSKDLVNFQKTLSLVRKIFLYVPELLKSGWQRQNISLLLSYTLDHGNHPRLRSLGFQLLLLWLNDQTVEYPECINLFSNAISLDLFVLDDIQPYNTTTTPAPTHFSTHLQSPSHLYNNEEPAHKPQTHGLQFVKKLRDSHIERHSQHGLQRDDKIKSSSIQVDQKLIFGGNNSQSAPIFPNPAQPTFHDSIALIHIFLNNLVRLAYVASGSPPPPDEYDYPPGDYYEPDDGIAIGVGIDAATASAKFLFKIFRTHYMTKFVPAISRALYIKGTSENRALGFPSCPPTILRSMLKFLIGHCLDMQPSSQVLSSSSCSISPATPILKSIVLSSHETREMLHEIIRQSLLLPSTNSSYRDIIRGAIHILGIWMLGSPEDRPSFLRDSTTRSNSVASITTSLTNSDKRNSTVSSPISEDDELLDANSFLRRYLLVIKLVFLQDESTCREMRAAHLQLVTDWDGLVELYKDALSVYRALCVSKTGIELDLESWELMLQCLLEIEQGFLDRPEKYSRIPVQSLAEELADYVWETLLHAFVRAKITHMELWQNLKVHMVQSMRWVQVLNQWVRIMQKLTRLLSSRLYKVEYELYPDTKYRLIEEPQPTNTTTNNRYSNARFSATGSGRSRVKSRRLSITEQQQEPIPEGSVSTILRNLSSASLSDLANTFKTDRKSTHLPSVMDEEDEEEEEDEEPQQSSSRFGSIKKIPLSAASSHPSSVYSTQASFGRKSGAENHRRTLSMHQLDSMWHDSSSKLLSFVHHNETSRAAHKEEDKKSDWETTSVEQVSITSMSESISIAAKSSSVNEKLPAGLGLFKCAEFLVLSNLPYDGNQILSIWKNMLLIIGNINEIKSPQNYAIAMNCIVEIQDTLRMVRARQPYNEVSIPAMYELAPWLFQAAELPSEFNVGKAAAYGSLCRLMIQKPEETVPEGYNAAFCHAILKGLHSSSTAIIQAIILNSERLFGSSIPGVHILIPSFITAIENQLFDSDSRRQIVGKSCITILGSLVSVSNNLRHLTIQVDDMVWLTNHEKNEPFAFVHLKVLLKNTLIRLVDSENASIEDTDTYCMVLDNLLVLTLDELLVSESPEYDLIYECVSSLSNHFYSNNISIVNCVVDCLETLSQVYKHELDPDRIILQDVLAKAIDALTVHLRRPKDRGYIISKLFSCLLEWIMCIEPNIFSETDLCQLLFDVVELALYEGHEKRLPHRPKPAQSVPSLSFRLPMDKRPNTTIHAISSEMSEKDQEYVKESAEAVLLHLLNQFNNFAPPYGPATMHTTIIGPGVSQDDQDYNDYQYFAFNDTSIIAFAKLPTSQARIIIRDLTGRYAWDTKLEPKIETCNLENSIEYTSVVLPNETSEQETQQVDPMGTLLKRIGESHSDCLIDPSLPLNMPSAVTPLQLEMLGNLGNQLTEYLHKEQNQLQQESDIESWYLKVRELCQKELEKHTSKRGEATIQMQLVSQFSSNKEFVPAFPPEYEQSQVPFQQSRLFMSHMGFISYKNGDFQMLNKTPALFRDLRGLDRKHGRETMKIGLLYVAHGQEDESTILQNSQGSEKYNAFVNSLGWDIDIDTHTGYLGGLERNLTNGRKATYYCSSTLEMIFHDVTKMPTDTSDPKQLKKKRHIGNDHVHIVWNEHDRDYRFDTIGGDFGNAQIVVTPLPDNLYSIQVYRDSKIPYFGPLADRMIVSQPILNSLVRSTAIAAFRASLHTNLYSFYKCVYAQRANDVRTITNRHKVSNWNYDQFMEKIFMPEEH